MTTSQNGRNKKNKNTSGLGGSFNLTFGIFLLTPPALDTLQRALQFLLVTTVLSPQLQITGGYKRKLKYTQ